ncbi:gliding motility-associated C-terminal domain-containing protein [Ferruginibacter sp. HRS2-29]|uniref:gliding motility-associated C-terminal domain-containing protein n=1 Tax=Ferruginibacter sp. HRS2-29 TaxID=2487334 RepID=UPI0020CF4408|nr:PKD domain-containing protein [Ferruginibacter sp. HRS2-29]MCP9751780.1 PKD domain-containing protein [Ferruginibacter sp. HRS2-29]
MRLSLLVFLLLCFSFSVKSQVCSGPFMTAGTAQAVCGTLTFNLGTLPNCDGPNIPNNTSGCGNIVTSDNSNWYKFHCYVGGTLGFLISPVMPEDFDWELMDITGHNPNDVYTMDLRVSLNLSGYVGVDGNTGCTAAGTSDVRCAGGGSGTQYNRMPTLIAGHDYLLMVTNFDASGRGYNLNFFGTAQLTDQVPPTTTNVLVTNCEANKIKLTFSEDILCNTITPTGSEFVITPGTHVITGITSTCSGGANSTTELTINLQDPLPGGNYSLQIKSGTDNNIFKDVCLDEMLPANIPFSVPTQTVAAITNIAFSGCAPKVLDVTLSKAVRCGSIAANGSDFSILPGNPAIVSATTICTGNPGVTRTVRLTLQNPLPYGNYQLQLKNGSDNNTIIDSCGIAMPVGYSAPLVIPQATAPPVIQSVGFDECHPAKLVLTFDKVINCASLSPTGDEFTIPSGSPVISATTNCGGNTYGNQVTLTLASPLPAGNFSVNVNSSPTDNNTISDTCFSYMVAGYSKPFVATQAPPLKMTGVTFSGCAPNVFTVKFTKPVLCSSISADGSEFTLTPGTNTITNIQFVCTPGATAYTEEIKLTFQNQVPYGNYQLNVFPGSDGNTLTDTCNVTMLATHSFPVVIPQTTTAPVIQAVTFDECKPFNVKVKFDKPVRCGSVSTNEFTVTPGSYTVTSVSSNCSSGALYADEMTLTLATKLPAGNFNVNIRNGSDNNTLSDTCFAFMPVGATRAFTTTQSPAPVFDSLQYDKCTPAQIKVFYSKAIRCASVITGGQQWNITGPSAVSITNVTGDPATCTSNAGGYSSWFILHLSAPVTTFGTYVLHNTTAGGLTITDTCFATQNPNNTISFNVLGKPSAAFTDQVRFGCEKDTLVLSHPGGNGINSWNWTFSDGTTANGPTVTHTFPVSTVTATAELIVSNGLCKDTLKRSYTLDNAFEPLFSINPVDTICKDKPLSFVNNSTGRNLQYLWQFGDNTTFAGQTPPAHNYAVSNDYMIRLIATNDHGCKDTATKQLYVTALPTASFGVLNPKYCAGDMVTLTGTVTGHISNYVWDNGDGKTFSNTNQVNFSYASEKNYTVKLTVSDRFCDAVVATASTQVYAVPAISLGEDKTLCPGMSTQIGVSSRSGYTYLWSTGATTSIIPTKLVSENYTLTADNHGCKGSDALFVNVLDNCLIKVAGAFTPNGDGRNDQLKAINADLATNFLLKVYNRFGQLVFSTTNPLEGWDGRQKGQGAESGTYVWQLSYVDPISKKPVYQKGTTVLIR